MALKIGSKTVPYTGDINVNGSPAYEVDYIDSNNVMHYCWTRRIYPTFARNMNCTYNDIKRTGTHNPSASASSTGTSVGVYGTYYYNDTIKPDVKHNVSTTDGAKTWYQPTWSITLYHNGTQMSDPSTVLAQNTLNHTITAKGSYNFVVRNNYSSGLEVQVSQNGGSTWTTVQNMAQGDYISGKYYDPIYVRLKYSSNYYPSSNGFRIETPRLFTFSYPGYFDYQSYSNIDDNIQLQLSLVSNYTNDIRIYNNRPFPLNLTNFSSTYGLEDDDGDVHYSDGPSFSSGKTIPPNSYLTITGYQWGTYGVVSLRATFSYNYAGASSGPITLSLLQPPVLSDLSYSEQDFKLTNPNNVACRLYICYSQNPEGENPFSMAPGQTRLFNDNNLSYISNSFDAYHYQELRDPVYAYLVSEGDGAQSTSTIILSAS